MIRMCKICNKQIEQRSWAGHCSGHVRSGETLKRIYKNPDNHRCQICELDFQSSQQLAGHNRTVHNRLFEDIKSDGARKNVLLRERGHKCEVCGLNEWCDKMMPIELDHVDGDCTNNSKENLRLICPNCHAQTDTYKGKNVGRVVGSKRQRTMKKYVGLYRGHQQ